MDLGWVLVIICVLVFLWPLLRRLGKVQGAEDAAEGQRVAASSLDASKIVEGQVWSTADSVLLAEDPEGVIAMDRLIAMVGLKGVAGQSGQWKQLYRTPAGNFFLRLPGMVVDGLHESEIVPLPAEKAHQLYVFFPLKQVPMDQAFVNLPRA